MRWPSWRRGAAATRRAQLFAGAMAGEVDEAALVERICTKRHQDSVRGLGLVPLSDDAGILRRYGVLRQFERGASQFGRQRQASEKTAVRIGVENLARTAGMADPQRFVWAMEAAEAGDLADGPISAVDDDVTVTLAVDAEGVPTIAVDRQGRVLKAVPPKSKKHPAVRAAGPQDRARPPGPPGAGLAGGGHGQPGRLHRRRPGRPRPPPGGRPHARPGRVRR